MVRWWRNVQCRAHTKLALNSNAPLSRFVADCLLLTKLIAMLPTSIAFLIAFQSISLRSQILGVHIWKSDLDKWHPLPRLARMTLRCFVEDDLRSHPALTTSTLRSRDHFTVTLQIKHPIKSTPCKLLSLYWWHFHSSRVKLLIHRNVVCNVESIGRCVIARHRLKICIDGAWSEEDVPREIPTKPRTIHETHPLTEALPTPHTFTPFWHFPWTLALPPPLPPRDVWSAL
jgi:hypothetical protein